MKKILFIALASLLLGSMSFAGENELKLVGNVGGYDIEMIIEVSDYDTGEFTGRYRYLSQENYLSIVGTNYGSVIYIEEFYNEKNTGAFYLDVEDENLTGWWANETKTFTVELKTFEGNKSHLSTKSLEDFSEECNNDITGTYEVDYYYISDYWVTEENPAYELGYSGGSIVFEDAGGGKLKFELEFVCGPTYHIASAEGIAVKDGDVYKYSEILWDEDACEITFKFSEKGVYASSNGNYTCGFGARAYVDHELIKTDDKIKKYHE